MSKTKAQPQKPDRKKPTHNTRVKDVNIPINPKLRNRLQRYEEYVDELLNDLDYSNSLNDWQ